MKPLIGEIAKKKIKVIANAGGVNLPACRKALEKAAQEAGVSLKIGVVEGDDLMPRLQELRGMNIREMQSGAPLPEKILSANAYLGAFPIAAALDAGADIVITGRCVDSALVLGPLIHEFGWKAGDFDLLAAGSLAGHLLECGAQATGGNFTDWREVADAWDNMGFPIAAAKSDGTFIITKPAGTGGLVSPLTVGEQLLYEIGDPKNYILPDVMCDFSGVRLIQEARDRVRVEGARGRPPSATYKVSATWPGEILLDRHHDRRRLRGRRARAPERRGDPEEEPQYARRRRARRLPPRHPERDRRRDLIWRQRARRQRSARGGAAACHSSRQKRGRRAFSREFVGSGLSMATGRCSVAAGRPNVSPVVRLYSFLIDKEKVPVAVSIDGKPVAFAPAKIAAATETPAKTSETAPALPSGRRIDVPLVKLAVARSGDKGNDANIGVMARRAEYLPAIRAALTPAAVKTYFAHYAEGPVERYDLPGLHALNFVLRDSLGGGGTSSANLDTQAKTYAQLLLAFPVPVPEAWSNELGAAGWQKREGRKSMKGLMMEMPLLLSGFMEYAANFHGDTEVVAREIEGDIHRYTYADAHRRMKRLAKALARLGVKQGDPIGTLAWNTHRHFEMFYGVPGMGAVLHTINPRLFADQLVYIVNHAEDRMIFLDAATLPVVEAIAPRLATVERYVVLAEEKRMPKTALKNVECYEALIGSKDDEDYSWPVFDENSASTICFTSGTTGNPKGVVYFHRAAVLQTLLAASFDFLPGHKSGVREVMMPMAPMFHGNAWNFPFSRALHRREARLSRA